MKSLVAAVVLAAVGTFGLVALAGAASPVRPRTLPAVPPALVSPASAPLPGGFIPTTCAEWRAAGGGDGPSIIQPIAVRYVWTCADTPSGLVLHGTALP